MDRTKCGADHDIIAGIKARGSANCIDVKQEGQNGVLELDFK
jgi:hypothetical protein